MEQHSEEKQEKHKMDQVVFIDKESLMNCNIVYIVQYTIVYERYLNKKDEKF